MEILERVDEGVAATTASVTTVGKSGRVTFSSSEILSEHDGHWTVRDLETGIFGTGPDSQAAIADFETALREHRDVLESQPALSDELQAQLRYLRRRLA